MNTRYLANGQFADINEIAAWVTDQYFGEDEATGEPSALYSVEVILRSGVSLTLDAGFSSIEQSKAYIESLMVNLSQNN